MGKRLLVVDWDYFVPYRDRTPDGAITDEVFLWDWGHREAPLFINGLWSFRAAAFLRANRPLPDTSGLETTFWGRFQFRPTAKLFYCESNAMAASPAVSGQRIKWSDVVLYDAHHDSGYRERTFVDYIRTVHNGKFSCENWMLLYRAIGATLRVRYPAWRAWALDPVNGEPIPPIQVDRQVDDGQPDPEPFDRIVVCRSGAWTPPWLDEKFALFVTSAPVKTKIPLGEIAVRPFVMSDAEQIAAFLHRGKEIVT